MGSTFCGKTVTQVFTGIENMPGVTYSAERGYSGMPKWCDLYNTGAVTTVTIVDNGIQPVNMDCWFGVGRLKVVSDLAQANDLNKIDTSKTTSMFGTFHFSRGLTSIDISSWDTSNVKNMEHMLSVCGTTTLDISNFNTSSVENMRGMFCGSLVLKTIKGISDLDVSNVTDMVAMFEQCYVLEDLDLSRWDVSNVTNMGEMFYWCGSLKTLDISNWNTSRVLVMERMFGGCRTLQSIKGIESLHTSGVSDMSYMFYDCIVLTANCSKWNVDSISQQNIHGNGHYEFNKNAPGVTPPKWKN